MKRVMVWDAPNMDMQLADIFGGGKPSQRPNMQRLMDWLVERAEDDELLACVFVNIGAMAAANEKFHGWLRYLSNQGFFVFAKHKDQQGQGDIDEDMVKYIMDNLDDCREVIIASHDAKCFESLVGPLRNRGITVTVLGFTGFLNGYDRVPDVNVLDLEWVPGVFSIPLPRELNIWNLPSGGKLFEPVTRRRLRPRSQRTSGKPEEAWRDQKLGGAMTGIKRCDVFVTALADHEPSIRTIGDLVNLTLKELLAVDGIGKTTAGLIVQRLSELKLSLCDG